MSECGSGDGERTRGEAAVEFEFGAAFRPVRTLRLGPCGERATRVTDVLPTAAGEFWVADAAAGALKLYSPEGDEVRALDRDDTGLSRPVSLVSLYGRWVVALDGRKPRVAILDEAGRPQRRFPLPEVDLATQVCNVADEWLAVAGPGWGAGAGKMMHLYTPTGAYVESLFTVPHAPIAAGRIHIAAYGESVYFTHSRGDSFGLYDVRLRTIISFPNLAIAGRRAPADRGGADPAAGWRSGIAGLFATRCGELLVMYSGLEDSGYFYDLYAVSGDPVALGLRAPERILALEGPFFFSAESGPSGELMLRIWKLRYPPAVAQGADAAPPVGARG